MEAPRERDRVIGAHNLTPSSITNKPENPILTIHKKLNKTSS
jgi:hypothetical protein